MVKSSARDFGGKLVQAGISGLYQFCMNVVRPNLLAKVLAGIVFLTGAVILAGAVVLADVVPR